MSKRDEAFGLFSQGKALGSPEVAALGLATASTKRYYRLWKQLNPEPAPCVPCGESEPVEVLPTISSIAKGATFEFQGLLLSREGTEGKLVVGSYLNNPGRKLLFAPDTPVKPK